MTEPDEPQISNAVGLTREVFGDIGSVAGQCCGLVDEDRATKWVTAAELIYDITGNPGRVVRNIIAFDLDNGSRIEVNLIDGRFELYSQEESEPKVGRKGLELLMAWKKMSFTDALEYIAQRYSLQKAAALGNDFVRMNVERIVTSAKEESREHR
ncbi:hypothetical protein [Bradyrhizobium ottawaense]|uniref:hypothetical protein n=1 Tax=Bradyrhizobium ottawaense TaxID=931866 RepID=UPI0027D5FF8B|nr:hypothetical protein BwSH12_77660 [Bradyrhizobium ottawaense]GMO78786.1 hypothetical protein BwSG10_48400 [Bradyrhizobium ottawaense]GMP04682.1 hypothetical protein BwSH20_43140 [Bradyrhizobium ottawaense]GMP05407.1 hypothetical protein BwDG23_48400 [Bradyrhizobium ottawaense]